MRLYSLDTGNLKTEGRMMFSHQKRESWEPYYPADSEGLCNWAIRSMLIDTGIRKILIDTGIGTKKHPEYFNDYHLNGETSLYNSLFKAGCQPNDITDVILTHLHFDHCGGSTVIDENGRLVLAFSNATYYVSEKQWDHALTSGKEEAGSFIEDDFMPIESAGKLRLINEEGSLFPGIDIRICNGHTRGLMLPFISHNNHIIVFAGDLVPSSAHIPDNHIMAYDIDPSLSFEEKKAFLHEAAREKYFLFLQHDLYAEYCLVKFAENTVVIDKKLKQDEICRGVF